MSPGPLEAHKRVELQSGRAILNVRHLTTYRYKRPVEFGDHRMMLRPRDGHDQQLLSSELGTRSRAEAAALALRYVRQLRRHRVGFRRPGHRSEFENRFTVERIEDEQPGGEIDPRAQFFPFSYAPEELPDVARAMERLYRRSCRGSRSLGASIRIVRGDDSDQPPLDDDDLRHQRRVLIRAAGGARGSNAAPNPGATPRLLPRLRGPDDRGCPRAWRRRPFRLRLCVCPEGGG